MDVTDSAPASAIGLWENFVKELGDDFLFSQILFHPAYGLLSDAIRSYDANAVQAACAMCRAATEAGCYVFLTRRYDKIPGGTGGKAWLIDYPKTLSGTPRDVSFGELSAAVKERKVLSPDEFVALRRIQEDGNLTVHLAARQDRGLHDLTNRFDPRTRGPREHEPLTPSIRLGVSKEEAYLNIRDSTRIILRLVRSAGPWRE